MGSRILSGAVRHGSPVRIGTSAAISWSSWGTDITLRLQRPRKWLRLKYSMVFRRQRISSRHAGRMCGNRYEECTGKYRRCVLQIRGRTRNYSAMNELDPQVTARLQQIKASDAVRPIFNRALSVSEKIASLRQMMQGIQPLGFPFEPVFRVEDFDLPGSAGNSNSPLCPANRWGRTAFHAGSGLLPWRSLCRGRSGQSRHAAPRAGKPRKMHRRFRRLPSRARASISCGQ